MKYQLGAGLGVLVSAALGVAAAIGAQGVFLDEALDYEAERLRTYIEERAVREAGPFQALIDAQHAAQAQFVRYWSHLDDTTHDQLFDTFFLEHPSGARRSRPDHFDGVLEHGGELYTYGMGAFLGETEPDAARRRALVAAYLTVRAAGPAYRSWFDNLYFNDDRNNLVIFAPDREDRLMYYREQAPADFSFNHLRFVRLTQPVNNPLGETRCTNLAVRLDREERRALHVSCHTPVRVNGLHLGAFGTSIDVRAYLMRALDAPPQGAQNLIVTRDGELVSHPALFEQDIITDADVEAVRAQIDVSEVTQAVINVGQPMGVTIAPDGSSLIGFARLEAPGWYFITQQSLPRAHRDSWVKAGLLGLVVVLILAGGVLSLLRRVITQRD